MGELAELELGRQAHREQVWGEAFALLTEADTGSSLSGEDLDRLAEAASMLGRGDDDVRLLRRAFLAHVEAGQVGPALRSGYWLCKSLAWAGEFAQAGAWLARVRRLAEAHPDCREYGYLLMLDAEQLIRAGEYAGTLAVARRLADIAGEGGDRDLGAGAAMTLGNGLIANGDVESGLTHLDESMVAVTGGEVSARATGMIYCVVIGTCQELYELHRARPSGQLSKCTYARPRLRATVGGRVRLVGPSWQLLLPPQPAPKEAPALRGCPQLPPGRAGWRAKGATAVPR